MSQTGGLARRPLFEAPSARFLVEDGGEWSGDRILGLARGVSVQLAETHGEAVGVYASSAAFVTAALLAAWTAGKLPILLDPGLKDEARSLREDRAGLTVFGHDAAEPPAWVRPVSEGAGGFAARWPDDDQPAVAFLTSGSTGRPKLVVKRGYQLFRQLEVELPWLGMTSPVSAFSLVPPFHIFGFMYGILAPLYDGGRTAFVRGPSPDAWIEQMIGQAPNTVLAVPSHYRFMLSTGRQLPREPLYLSSGAPLRRAVDLGVFERVGAHAVQIYGSTETGGLARRCGSQPWEPFPTVSWKVGDDGRLMVTSPWQDVPGAWVATDDLAESSEAGFCLLGRKDSIVKVGGKRISTDEISLAALTLDPVEHAETVVYERFGEHALALFVTIRNAHQIAESALRSTLCGVLAPYKVPRVVRVLPRFPLLSNGKIDRVQLSVDASSGKSSRSIV